MNAVKLLNAAPLLIMVAFLAYAGYSIHASAGDPAAGQSGLAKDKGAVVPDIVTAGDAMPGGPTGAFRDPFQVGLKPGAVATRDDAKLVPDSDILAEIVQGLTLSATFLQGRGQLAIINGRVYSKGQYVLVDGGSGKSLPPLFVVNVLPAKVVLRGGDKDYVLGYPDQLALSQKPHNSPIAAPGKSMIGNPGQAAPRSRHSRGARAATAAARTGNP
jgi:hypothetical protein